MKQTSSPVTSWRAAAILLAASILVSSSAGEALVRLFRPEFVAGPDPIANPFWRHDAELGWSHIAGAEGTFSRPEFAHHVRINSAGWRDRERTLDKPSGFFRIVVLGDSYTWGHGVEDEEIFTRLMEERLPGVEVINLGLSASATDQQLLILRQYGLAYHPDLVLVMVSRNDFIGNVETMEGSYPKPVFTLEEGGALRLTNVPVPGVSWFSRVHYRLRRRSGLLNLIESVLQGRVEGRGPAAQGRPRTDPYAVTCALLGEMRRETEAAGASFTVALAPSNAHTYLDPIPPLEAKRFQVIRDFGARESVPVLDLVPAFRDAARAGGRTDLHYPLDKHWNAAGHEVVARELARLLGRLELIPFHESSAPGTGASVGLTYNVRAFLTTRSFRGERCRSS
jgi:lysophospholipase L1-like esterase